MIKYRSHRGELADSLKTALEFANKQALINYLQSEANRLNLGIDCSKITIERYVPDPRNEQETHIVYLDGFGVFGFIDGQF